MSSEATDPARPTFEPAKALVDTVAPTVLFTVLSLTSSVAVASAVALGWCVLALLFRLLRRHPLTYAAGGLGGVAVGVVFALRSGEAEGFFLPGIIGNLALGALCLVSILFRQPAVAYTSAALYRWPIGWYLHDRVRPAYAEITLLWAVYYLAKGLLQLSLSRAGELAALATVRLALGWPGLIALVAVTYAYVRWRLDRLGGPDVETWKAASAADGADDAG